MPGIIFTDLDGTLLSHDDYRFESALPLIRELKSAGVQIVLSTSKTLTEVLTWRTRLGLDDPFMVENGSALYLPLGDFAETDLGDAPFTRTDAFFRVVLGTPISRLEKFLAPYEGEVTTLTGCSLAEAITLTGLTEPEAIAARAREFTLPLVVHSEAVRDKLTHNAGAAGLTCQQGGRFLHLQGASDKGQALRLLVRIMSARTGSHHQSLALGDSENDRHMLEAADIAVVVRSPRGTACS